MKVVLDELRCDAHGVCVTACPEVFALEDTDDIVRIICAEPDESLRDKVQKAVKACPKAAITVED